LNYSKVLGNFLIAFATAFIAASWIGGIDALAIASINALILGALSVGKELQEEADTPIIPLLDKAVLL